MKLSPAKISWARPRSENHLPILLLLLLLSRFSHVRLCVTPQMAAHQAPLFLRFSRQEHWSGLPYPPPMHEVKRESEVAQSCPTQWPHGLQPTRLLRPWDFPGKSTGVGRHCLLWSRNSRNSKSWSECRAQGALLHCAGDGNWEQPLWREDARQLPQHEKEGEIRWSPNTTHKNKLQVDQRSK